MYVKMYFHRLRAGSVIESQCPFVCVSVTKVVIVDNGHAVRVVFPSFSENRVGMYGSKDSTSRRTLKLHDRFKS